MWTSPTPATTPAADTYPPPSWHTDTAELAHRHLRAARPRTAGDPHATKRWRAARGAVTMVNVTECESMVACVRRAAASDVTVLGELRAEMFRAMGTAGVQHPGWRRSAQDWFGAHHDNPQGVPRGRAHARRRGHGQVASAAVPHWARSTGVARAELMATGDGLTLYEAAGFTATRYPAMRATLSAAPDHP